MLSASRLCNYLNRLRNFVPVLGNGLQFIEHHYQGLFARFSRRLNRLNQCLKVLSLFFQNFLGSDFVCIRKIVDKSRSMDRAKTRC
jgi:hypothetical protein